MDVNEQRAAWRKLLGEQLKGKPLERYVSDIVIATRKSDSPVTADLARDWLDGFMIPDIEPHFNALMGAIGLSYSYSKLSEHASPAMRGLAAKRDAFAAVWPNRKFAAGATVVERAAHEGRLSASLTKSDEAFQHNNARINQCAEGWVAELPSELPVDVHAVINMVKNSYRPGSTLKSLPQAYWQAVLMKFHDPVEWNLMQTLPWHDVVVDIPSQGAYFMAVRLWMGMDQTHFCHLLGFTTDEVSKLEKNHLSPDRQGQAEKAIQRLEQRMKDINPDIQIFNAELLHALSNDPSTAKRLTERFGGRSMKPGGQGSGGRS